MRRVAARTIRAGTWWLGPALEDFPSGDDLADAERLNAVLEAEIERNVEQYLWVHRRFKTRPPGAPPAYAPALLRRRREGDGRGQGQAGAGHEPGCR